MLLTICIQFQQAIITFQHLHTISIFFLICQKKQKQKKQWMIKSGDLG